MKLFLTNLPAFYKINLYNALAKKMSIFVVYTGLDTTTRNKDFYNGEMEFQYVILKGNQLNKAWKFYKIVMKYMPSELVLSSWETLIPWLVAFKFARKYNSVIVESSIKESTTRGIKGFLKRLFFSRCSKAYVSGKMQEELVLKLNPSIICIKTRGVGVFNYNEQPLFVERRIVRNFLYVGRLVWEKNLKWLIMRFNNHPELHLTIIGFGKMESQLKYIAKSNITFVGAVNNMELSKYYQEADVFILPSIKEPWGLVVEEAFNNGLPVMVSENVGCAEEIVNDNNGIVFKLNDIDFENKLNQILDINRYNQMRFNISKMDFRKIEEEQINCYLK